MLQSLSIRDFIIVDTLDLEFSSGFTTLTGETGAGKSILIDALSLALGARADGAVTRAGCEKADITAVLNGFQMSKSWLQDNELPVEDDIILRRVIYADGRSRAFINGTAASVGQLKEIGEMLVDIYSQNAHHSLLKLATQRQILDDFAGQTALAKQVASQFKTWQELSAQLQAYEQNAAAFADELAELRDKTRELTALNFTADYWVELQAEHARLSNGAALLQGVEASCAQLRDAEINVQDLLASAQSQLQHLTGFDAALNEPLETINSAMILVDEASRSLNRYLQKAELDPARLAVVDSEMQNIHNTARKYRIKVDDLPTDLASCQARMAELAGFAADGALQKNVQLAQDAYQTSAQSLSQARAKFAAILSQQISQHMQTLSLAGGQFSVALNPQTPSANGLELVEFLVAGHAGVAPRPLNKVASGGELSRISLALHVTTSAQNTVPTMIFDEVDVGIGGGVAEVVGQLLANLGKQNQVLVITHLPQVAAQAAQHLQVRKTQANGQTLSHISALNTAERVEEIARMLGGLQITDTTRNHAKEMLKI